MLWLLLIACRRGPAPESDSAPLPLPVNESCRPLVPGAGELSVALEPWTEHSFRLPVGGAHLQGRTWIVEKGGLVYTFTESDDAPTLALDLSEVVFTEANETGLLGIAPHPDWPDEPSVFLSWVEGPSEDDLQSVVARFESDADGVLEPDSQQRVFTLAQPRHNHNGGRIGFDAQGMLLVPVGDGGAGDTKRALDPFEPYGKVHRLDVDADAPYGIPADNPFADGERGSPTVWAMGFRNPWGWDVDRGSGELWVADVGWNTAEEVNRVEPGGSYGWPAWEGTLCLKDSLCSGEHIPPVSTYLHEDGGVSVTGGLVYRGSELPALVGSFLYTDIALGTLWAVRDGEEPVVLMDSTGLKVASFLEVDDQVVLLEYALDGGLYRLVPGEDLQADSLPERLSETGCVDPDAPSSPAEGLLDYGVRLPFHADGADKRRWLALPPGELPELDQGRLVLPPGSVLVKELSYGGEPRETRLLMRQDDGSWTGITYAWEGDDAVLVNGSQGDGQWRIPSRAECLQCHSQEAGVSLGMDLHQLSVDEAQWQRWGLLPETLPEVRALESGDPRSWLHANCAHCHRGEGSVSLDLRVDTPLGLTGLCGPAERWDQGVGEGLLVVPGAPEDSVLMARLTREDAYRMPPSRVRPDTEGHALVEAWIGEMEVCE